MATSSHVINGSIIKLPFDPVKDFAGVSLLATSPLVLAVNAKTQAGSLADVLNLARRSPQGLTSASSGLASLPHLTTELLSRAANVKLVHVPYKGSGPAETDLLGGQVDMYFGSPTSLLPHVKSGALRLLATTGPKRSRAFPDLPAVSETYPGFRADAFYAVLAPAGTPATIVDRLNAAIRQVLDAPDVSERLASVGAEVVGSSPAEANRFIQAQVRQWDQVVKDANIKAN